MSKVSHSIDPDLNTRNLILRFEDKLRDQHYILRSSTHPRRWVAFSPNKVKSYNEKLSGNFCLVIVGNETISNDFYAIPWVVIKDIFTEENVYPAPTKNGKVNPRWQIHLEGPPHVFQMEFAKGDPRTRPIFDASKWYGNTSILTAITSNSLQVEEIIADLASKMDSTGDFEISSIKESREKVLTEIVRRRGQPKFRKMLLDAYGGCCAFSGCSVEAVLEAAHIHPYKGPLTNHPQNGLLLRTDLHTLFDLGLLTVNTDNMTIVIDPKLANTEYAQFSGKKLHLPSEISMRPSVDALNAHHHRKGQIVKDLEILNRRADNLNAEAEDVLAYQINNVDC